MPTTKKFCDKLNQLLVDIGIIDVNKTALSEMNYQILSAYSDEEIIDAIRQVLMTSTYGVKVADIVKVLTQSRITELKADAERAYNLLCASRTCYDDVIIDDVVAAKTIKALYSSVQRFNERPVEATNTDYALKLFVERYIEIAERITDAERKVSSNYYFQGRDHGNSPAVEYIGEFDICQAIAFSIYKEKTPRLPQDPKLRKSAPKIENKEPSLPKEETIKVMKRVMDACNLGKKEPKHD